MSFYCFQRLEDLPEGITTYDINLSLGCGGMEAEGEFSRNRAWSNREENHDSGITGILSRSPKMETDKTYDIVVFATDLEGDSFSYGWSKDSGIILDDGNSNTIQ